MPICSLLSKRGRSRRSGVAIRATRPTQIRSFPQVDVSATNVASGRVQDCRFGQHGAPAVTSVMVRATRAPLGSGYAELTCETLSSHCDGSMSVPKGPALIAIVA